MSRTKLIDHTYWSFKHIGSLSLLVILGLITSCEKNDPEIPNEEELITTLTYTLTPTAGGTAVVFSFQDLDGDGGGAPIITNGTLAANTSYSGALQLLNETENPAADITEEVAAESDQHQFFFAAGNGLNLQTTYADVDDNGNPIGLSTFVTTGDASSGSLTITLRHKPDKLADGVSTGDITNAGGETDMEVTFDLIVQ